MTSNYSYTAHRTAYHLGLGLLLLIAGAVGLYLITEVTNMAREGQTPLQLAIAPFTLPVALVLALIPLVLEILNREGKIRLSSTGFIVSLIVIFALIWGWYHFSKPRFENWLQLPELEYERCTALDNNGEAWVKAGNCE